jgi:RHS repeat-associated protein
MPVTNYFWDPLQDNVTKEYDDNGDTIVRYATEPDLYGNLISQERDGVANYYHFDGQGSALALTDEAGDIDDEYAYYASGETSERVGTTANSRLYIGEKGYEHDQESSTYNVRSRTYKPSIARWLSTDPLGFADGLNLYAYVLNNSLKFLDPLGAQAEDGLAGCCCCPESLLIDGARTVEGRFANLVAAFDVDYVRGGGGPTAQCDLLWWEKSNIPYAANDIPGHWVEMRAAMRGSGTQKIRDYYTFVFGPWDDFVGSGRSGPINPGPVTLHDQPHHLPVGRDWTLSGFGVHRRVVLFAIELRPGAACAKGEKEACEIKRLCAMQVIRMERRERRRPLFSSALTQIPCSQLLLVGEGLGWGRQPGEEGTSTNVPVAGEASYPPGFEPQEKSEEWYG